MSSGEQVSKSSRTHTTDFVPPFTTVSISLDRMLSQSLRACDIFGGFEKSIRKTTPQAWYIRNTAHTLFYVAGPIACAFP